MLFLDRQNSYWIGLQRSSPTCQSNEPFSCWNDGTPVRYIDSWNEGELSSLQYEDEDCVVMGHPRYQSDNSDYLWYNIPCRGVIDEQTYLASYVCHKNRGKFYKTPKVNL